MMNEIRVNVDRQNLLLALKANFEKYKTEFAAAKDGFQDQMVSLLEEKLAEAKAGKLENLHIYLNAPEDNSSSYQDAIDMFEMGTDITVSLDSASVQAYVKDKWNWREGFNASNAAYISASMAKRR